MKSNNRYRALLIPFIVLIQSCFTQPSLNTALDEYQARLSRVLDTQFSKPEISSSNHPSATDLRVELEAVEINMREFYAIKNCRFAALVAQRNSALGKTQLPSQRYLYERNLLFAFDECSEEIAALKPDLSAKLQALKQLKQEQFPKVWVKMMQQSDEIQSALSRKNGLIELSNRDAYAQTLQDWRFLSSLRNISDNLQDGLHSQLENSLKRIGNTRLPATLTASQLKLSEDLNSLSLGLADTLPLVECPNGKASQQAEILRNVFVLFFVEKLQPLGSLINALHYDLQPIFDSFSEMPVGDKFEQSISAQRHLLFEQYRTSIHNHVTLWQTFFKRCNLAPQVPV